MLVVFLLQVVFAEGQAQSSKNTRYIPATDITIVGKVMPTANPYYRVDTAKYSNLPKRVLDRLKQSAGLAVAFKTNSLFGFAYFTRAKVNGTIEANFFAARHSY